MSKKNFLPTLVSESQVDACLWFCILLFWIFRFYVNFLLNLNFWYKIKFHQIAWNWGLETWQYDCWMFFTYLGLKIALKTTLNRWNQKQNWRSKTMTIKSPFHRILVTLTPNNHTRRIIDKRPLIALWILGWLMVKIEELNVTHLRVIWQLAGCNQVWKTRLPKLVSQLGQIEPINTLDLVDWSLVNG